MASKDAVLLRGVCLLFLFIAAGAKHASPNFEVEAPTAAIAEKVALTAERCREELAIEWLGHKLPNWYQPCKVRVKVGQMGAGGATTFSFSHGEVYGWDMTVQGSLERILDSVIPHEVCHTIFACHFRRPLPRWADEGAATLVEDESERRRQKKLAEEVLPSKRRIGLRELLKITEYPQNMQHVLTLYAEGYLLADYLVQRGGKPKFLAFVQDSFDGGWDAALRTHYREESIESLESKWSQWVISGSPALRQPEGVLVAAATSNASRDPSGTEVDSVIRSQNPDPNSSDRSLSALVAKPEKTAVNQHASQEFAGHSVRTRSESVSAPQPRRKTPTAEQISVDADQPAAEPRRVRGSHLSHPELRRPIANPS